MTRATPPGETIACRRCGSAVSAEAPRCPECKADPRTGWSSYRDAERDRVRVCEGVGVRFLAFAVDFVLLAVVFLLVALLVCLILVGAGEFAVVGQELPPWPLRVVSSIAAFFYSWVGVRPWTMPAGEIAAGRLPTAPWPGEAAPGPAPAPSPTAT